MHSISRQFGSLRLFSEVQMALRLSEFATMTEQERAETLENLASQSSPASRRIRRFEIRYEMSSMEMRRKVASGEMKETADIAAWLFWLNGQRNHVAG
jgi:hypothetical protein